ncbi:hypothetical protein Pint_05100 [Pistacia integerrima]|uniref:Uncharacterized protein n=1 Tax=Pistacia integerrima TaxID=434235 RepID=A0ACC0Z2Q6_9ROSI|nr:hypothetical protein Pint_05100 [Pistacia integerrima]
MLHRMQEILRPLIRANPDITITEKALVLNSKYEITVRDITYFRAKALAFKIHGKDHRLYFNKINSYARALKQWNEKASVFILSEQLRQTNTTRRIYANMKKDWPSIKLKMLFWATSTQKFKMIMEEIKQVNQDAYNWLMKIEAKQWSRWAFNPEIESYHVTNNHSESFNN